MPVAALYDIHGNLPALEAVLAEVQSARVDRILIGGDILPGPMPREILKRLIELEIPTTFIRGNCEIDALASLRGVENDSLQPQFRDAMRWSAAQLLPDYQAHVAAWPATVTWSIPPLGDVLFCHATPRSATDIFLDDTPDAALLPHFSGITAATVVCGHTHMQFDRWVGPARVINAGSVGMPFDAPGAYWLLLGPDVQLRSTAYDRNAAAVRIRETGYPLAGEFADKYVLNPPTRAEMKEAFARAALK
jgi:predicted phosphodiesterase